MPKQNIPMIPPPRWITRDTAKALRCSMRSVQNYRDNCGLPFMKISARKFIYDPAAVEQWAKARSRKSNANGQ